jgi:RNA polymerase sigma-70 factor (ECF subfamily)
MTGNYERAFSAAWDAYRPEMLRFLFGVLRDEDGSQEVFSAFSEELWKGLPSFRWQSSFRTWGYRLLRASCFRYLHSPKRREQPASTPVAVEEAASNRSNTNPWLKTDVKQGFAALRESLDPDDQIVLLLRIDRKMSWMEIAQIMDDGKEPSSGATIRRKAAAIRQHFHRIKVHLREMASAAGLLTPDM